MKLAGFLLLLAGWAIVLTAVAILPPGSVPAAAFLLSGLSVEALGMGLVVRAHLPAPPERGSQQAERF